MAISQIPLPPRRTAKSPSFQGTAGPPPVAFSSIEAQQSSRAFFLSSCLRSKSATSLSRCSTRLAARSTPSFISCMQKSALKSPRELFFRAKSSSQTLLAASARFEQSVSSSSSSSSPAAATGLGGGFDQVAWAACNACACETIVLPACGPGLEGGEESARTGPGPPATFFAATPSPTVEVDGAVLTGGGCCEPFSDALDETSSAFFFGLGFRHTLGSYPSVGLDRYRRSAPLPIRPFHLAAWQSLHAETHVTSP
mmetsp:Transcript_57716/g.137340  ORF Transcript_57716/g.137340 Transcript_57716/m.137340 type:complete len:255 (+) Transcript_57716:1785-2549(+)